MSIIFMIFDKNIEKWETRRLYKEPNKMAWSRQVSVSTFTNFLSKFAGIEAVIARIWNTVTQYSLRNLEVIVFSDS